LPYFTDESRADRWLVFAALAGLGALAIAIYRYERIASRFRVPGEPDRPARSLTPLAAMRLGLLFLTLVVLLPQLRLFFEREGWPDVVLLIDTSKSFSKPDDYQDDNVRKRAEELGLDWAKLAEPKIKATQARIAQLEPKAATETDAARELAEQRDLLAELQS